MSRQFVVTDTEGYFWIAHRRFSEVLDGSAKLDISQAESIKRMLDEVHAEKYATTCSKAYGEYMRTLCAKIYEIIDGRMVQFALNK